MVAQVEEIRTKIFYWRILGLLLWGDVPRISPVLKQEFHVLADEPVNMLVSTILTLFF